MGKTKHDHPTNVPGAVMEDNYGNEVFVVTQHQYGLVRDRLKMGWKMIDDRRPKGHPSHPDYKSET